MDYRSFNDEMQEMFGGKVYRLALSIGATCPNRDGRCGTGGCIFCSAGGSGDFAADASLPVTEQIREAKRRVEAKQSRNFAGYMAYFQSFTSTYARNAEEALLQQEAFTEALRQPEVLALSIATRPDCLPDETVRAIADLQKQFQKPVWVELGLQTVHEDTAAYIHRGYRLPVFEDALRRLNAAGLRTVVHVIAGLPGENAGRTAETVRYLAALPVDGIKLQLLHIMKGTPLAELLPDCLYNCPEDLYNCNGDFKKHQIFLKDGMVLPCYNMCEYAELAAELVSLLPPRVTVHRLTGDAPRALLLHPLWTTDKKRTLNAINAAIRSRVRQ